MAREQYMRQVDLLVRTLPFIARHEAFALKGGTAINLFYRDMPRLSVDIDLTYLRIEDRETTLKNIDTTLEHISGDVQLARRFEQFTLSRWAANEQFETLVVSILRNTPLRQSSVLTAKSLRRMLQITEGITANIFHTINTLAIEGIESGREQITNEAIEKWEPEFDAEAAFA